VEEWKEGAERWPDLRRSEMEPEGGDQAGGAASSPLDAMVRTHEPDFSPELAWIFFIHAQNRL
jgi:hypothetical protein